MSYQPTNMGHEPIAVIGSGCRFPGEANSPSKLWELLREPRDVLSEIPDSRFNVDRFYHPDNAHHGTSNVRHSYLLAEDHRLFDAQFFGVKPVEAIAVDPQQRLLLETVYESLEAAGISIEQLQGSQTGVFVGLMSVDYADMLGVDLDYFPTYFAPGTARSIMSNRVSYFFDWHGPSVTIDTACSSSLVAVHQAVQTLRSGESRVAVAAGANLLLGPAQYVAESKLKMLSPHGRSRMWDESADGYARGDGFAAVVLKTLSAALADGDHIECLVRETGFNQDGRTKGITMPSPTAQTDLIRQTYRRAGLDLQRPSDRPQYFEAHGTGTPAGDPVEAQAISQAFFGPDASFSRASEGSPLAVGSIKTVIGHTEGTAGLAALLKASLALQHGIIPPNMLFNRLNPAIEPFYHDLQVATSAKAWPTVEPGAPRRASVNSFGFGGANAHAILESYDPPYPSPLSTIQQTISSVFTPFTFSAVSERSLAATLAAYSGHLQANPDINLRDLAFTLNSRRSTFPVRAAFSALSIQELCTKLDSHSQPSKSRPDATTNSLNVENPAILGVFTGQGAQWARMGAELLQSSPAAREIVDRLEESLRSLPPADRPSWSLAEELLAPSETSRINQAEISQPLCTALQIMLVELLRQAGITFAAVVGHSSGEIAAAYAAGYLSAEDSIRIAYYRGFHLHLANGPGGRGGSMMAVGTSFEDATELCSLPAFEGRLCVAASNSSASVTISGDSDAIQEAKDVFEEEKKFARILKVDKAYHSHHMAPCYDTYVNGLRACNIKMIRQPNSKCSWISSVYSQDMADIDEDLRDKYWADNMARPVLFSQALSYAVGERGPFDVAIEVGPHPALRGPVNQTIQEVSGDGIVYTGCLKRGENDVKAFAECQGSLWASLGSSAVDFAGFERFAGGGIKQNLLKNLPGYSWDHERVYWHESRVSKAYRSNPIPSHELLGTRTNEGTQQEVRWRNYLSSKEVPWLKDHQVQGQMVFPGAGYISAVIEGVNQLFGDEGIKMVELRDINIGQALMLEEGSSVETLLSLSNIVHNMHLITARFSFYSAVGKDSTAMAQNASGYVQVALGEASADTLPSRPAPEINLLDVELERFYNAVGELGFGYTGPFKALSELRRKMDVATGVIATPQPSPSFNGLIIHPATLDAAIQSIILAYCFPGDSRLRTIHLPTSFDSIRINNPYCISHGTAGLNLQFQSSVPPGESGDINGDVDIYSEDGQHTLIQLQGLHTKPLNPPSAENDLHLFTEMVWEHESPTGSLLAQESAQLASEYDLSLALERVAYFYLSSLDKAFPRAEREELGTPHHTRLFAYVDHVLSRVSGGTHPYVRDEWLNDTYDNVISILKTYPDSIDLKMMHAVGQNLPAVLRGEITMLEPMVQDNMLNKFYVDAFGMPSYLQDLTRMARQISHRYPHMSILEIGAGTGGATKVILRELDNAFLSYSYTDISSGFFEKAQEVFQAHQSKMSFKTLDIEKDVIEQGFAEHSFDMIIASLVLHATSNLEVTMQNVRRLLKPGGYLLLLEITDNDPMRFGFIFGGLPGWWLGHDDGRALSPCIGPAEWDVVMRKTGFSGIDAITPHATTYPLPLSVIVTQAVDERVNFLRQPRSASLGKALETNDLTIVGGTTESIAKVVEDIAKILVPHYGRISIVKSLDYNTLQGIAVMGSVLCLTDLDEPVFKSISAEKLQAFQHIFKQSKSVLWVTQGRVADNPYSNMVVGFGRSIVLEMTHLRLQYLDVESLDDVDAEVFSEKLLQLEATEQWEQQGPQNSLLWYTESEIGLKKGSIHVPRVRLSKKRNQRYNSARRLITKEMDPTTTPISIVPSGASYVLKDNHSSAHLRGSGSFARAGYLKIQVRHSILRSIKINSTDYVFVVLGTNVATGEQVIALSDAQKSIIETNRSWTIPCFAPSDQSLENLLVIYEHLMAQALVASVAPGEALAVLEPSRFLTLVLARRAAEKGIDLVLLTSNLSLDNKRYIFLHPRESKRAITAKLLGNISLFVNLADNDDAAALIGECLSPRCKVESWGSLTARTSSVGFESVDFIPGLLRAAWARSQSEGFGINLQDVPTVKLGDPEPEKTRDGRICLVDWTASSVPVQIQSADSMVKFSHDKTYWLVGLTGSLGLSLCRWMIDHGARYVVVTSRNPKVDPRWMQSVEAVGATVKIYANDITDREAVRSVYKRICAELPPVAGVAQGAMVLHDTMFPALTMDTLQKVIKPKVNGSIYLDEIFKDTQLEFFVFLSSIASLTGNPGQSAYGAANMFMNSLAEQRRKRGLAGSAIEVGAIMGNGYITRELTLAQQDFLQKVGNTWMSEQDFLQIFAEGVLASAPDSTESVDTATGLRIQYGDGDTTWASNPMFQHLVMKTGGVVVGATKAKSGVPVKTRLRAATSHDDVFAILKDAFIEKLQSALQADPERSLLALSPDELGIDSLVAVDIRSWFLKELNVEIPVLKILNGGSAGDLLKHAQELLPAALIPDVATDSNSSTESRKATAPLKIELPIPKPMYDGTKKTEQGIPDTPEALLTPSTNSNQSNSTSASEENGESDLATSTASESSVSDLASDENAIQRKLPMSFGQSRFWFLRYYLEDQTAFNITSVIRLRGTLRMGDLKKAVEAVGQRHEALRTSFFTDETHQHTQAVLQSSLLRLERGTISDESEVQEAYERIKNHVYNLECGEVIKVQVLSLSPISHFLILGYHHINMDGISFEIFFSDVQKAYDGVAMTAGTLQYPDFALRERKQYESGAWADEFAFWSKEFPDLLEPLPLLPLSRKSSRPTLTSYATHQAKLRINPQLSAQIKETCRRFKVTPFHFHLAVLKTLILRHLDVDSLCIGVGDANRKDEDVLQSIGLFLNLLPLRFQSQPAQTFGDALKEARHKSQEAFAHSRVPFDVLLKHLNVPRSAAHSPLFQVFLNYRQGVQEARHFCGCDCEGEMVGAGQIAYDISLDVVDNAGGDALVMLAVQKELYSVEDANTLLENYSNLLEVFSKNPASRLNRPALHREDQVQEALILGCGPIYQYTWPETIPHRIDEMTRVYSGNAALKNGTGPGYTYGEMGMRINSIAARLHAAGFGEGARAGVFQEPTMDWICSLLAIWRLGGTYIPLDPRITVTRLAAIAKDCQPDCVLADSSTELDFSALDCRAQLINVSEIVTLSSLEVPNTARAEAPAAIMYTSGSTGVPKGVVLKHSSFRNNIEISTHQFDFRAGSDVVLQQGAYSFDMSLSQTFIALCNGGTLIVAPKNSRGDPIALSELIAAEGVTLTQATPSEYINWLRYGSAHLQGSKWRIAASGGEKATPALTEGFKAVGKQDLRLFNGYGPTEITFTSHSRELFYWDDGACDLPLQTWPNYSTYIVDRHMNALPLGVPGEVFIGGAGVALGYFNNDKLSAERFLRDLFAPAGFSPQDYPTMHRTGDRGRLSREGHLILEGRIAGDTQVKLRGLRMDLQDIEATIMQSSNGAIVQAAVSVRQAEASGPQFLVAHVAFSPEHVSADKDQFLQQLLVNLPLPQYMRPAMIIPLDTMPVNSSNKLDRLTIDALSLPQAQQKHTTLTLTPIEASIRDIWNEVLPEDIANRYEINSESDFFHAGGSSLLLVSLQGLLKNRYNVSLPLHRLFESSTLGAMAVLVEHGSPAPKDNQIDWEEEATLAPDLEQPQASQSVVESTGLPSVVVLTGASGFVGKAVLERLVQDDNIKTIYCIAVRKDLDQLPPIFSSSKVQVRRGDLADERVGLSEADATAIFDEADVVLHNGADVSFMKTYRTLKRTNVNSTKELVRLSLPRRIPFHFISSASVTQLSSLDEFGEVSVAPYPPPSNTQDGYTAAKWVCERYLEKIAENFGLPIWIHRPSSITGEGASDLDLMGNLMKYVELLESVPQSTSWNGYFDFISVTSVASEIVHAVRSSGAGRRTVAGSTVSYLYESGEIVYPLSIMKELSDQMGDGGPVETVPLEEWVDRAEKLGLNPMLAAYLRSANETAGLLAFPRLVKSS